MASAARKLPSGSGPRAVEQAGKQSATSHLAPHQFKPGQSGNPKGRPAGKSREEVVRNFFEMLSKKAQGQDVPYLEIMMQRVLASEHLLGKFIDKLLPNMSNDQTNLVVNNFENVLAQINAQRALASMPVPGLAVPFPAPAPEPELEPLNRKDGG